MQVAAQQQILITAAKRAIVEQQRRKAVNEYAHVHGMEQVLDSAGATGQLSSSCSDNLKSSPPSQTHREPVKWRVSDPWFTYTAFTVAVGALALW